MSDDPTTDALRYGGLAGWDLEGFHTGADTEIWKRLGSHLVTVDGPEGPVSGTRFAVWAPQAKAVSVHGDFNDWSGQPMELLPGTGVWVGFVPGVGAGALYKYSVQTQWGEWLEKADPMARYAEIPPASASIVWESDYTWSDQEWLERRAEADLHAEPMSIYELHLGSWRKGKSYREVTEELVEYVTWQGYTHVELLPLSQHPYEPSWGYQVTGYFAAQSTFGNPDDLRHLIDRLHQAGIGVIMDWVPGHFPKDSWGLGRFDGSALYEHADPRQGEHRDWGTYIFNYGRNEVKSFLVSNALYWLTEFHVDGLRVDAVASMLYLDYSREEGQWVPNIYGGRENLEAIDFLRYVNSHLQKRVAGIAMIAEESTSFPGVTLPVEEGGLGFTFKWNMGWMNDTLSYIEDDPIYRQYHHNNLTFGLVYAWSEHFILPISHDEVVHGKGSMINKVPGDDWQKFATLRAYYAFMWSHPGKQLLFMGSEFGQRPEFNEAVSLEWWVSDLWGHHGLQLLLRDLNRVYRSHPALYTADSDPAGFAWIDAGDASGNTISFLRRGTGGEQLAAVINFSPVPREAMTIGLPSTGSWHEVLNTDSEIYDGTGKYGNLGQVEALAEPWNDFPARASVVVPPMGAVWFSQDPVEQNPGHESDR
ncbi:1,4-alpha-glucan branching protein GlgB [Naumannella halotolerans]|nr:1,4-alpha-glucan branching protein GlgB [Naumannella halotolerans]